MKTCASLQCALSPASYSLLIKEIYYSFILCKHRLTINIPSAFSKSNVAAYLAQLLSFLIPGISTK